TSLCAPDPRHHVASRCGGGLGGRAASIRLRGGQSRPPRNRACPNTAPKIEPSWSTTRSSLSTAEHVRDPGNERGAPAWNAGSIRRGCRAVGVGGGPPSGGTRNRSGSGPGAPRCHRSGEDPKGRTQRALGNDGEDRVLPAVIHRRPVVVGGDEGPLGDRFEAVAVDVAEVELTFHGPRDLSISLELDDLDGHVVETEGVVVECLAVHVDDEGVTRAGDGVTRGIHQHSRTVDRDMPAGITQHAEDRGGISSDGPLDFEALSHCTILASVWDLLPPEPCPQ